MPNNIVLTLLCVAAFFGLFACMMIGVEKNEIRRCLVLQDQASEYEGFYITKWQKDMCDAHDIIINAPVR